MTVGSRSTNTALGTCLPAPVSLKNVLKASWQEPTVVSLHRDQVVQMSTQFPLNLITCYDISKYKIVKIFNQSINQNQDFLNQWHWVYSSQSIKQKKKEKTLNCGLFQLVLQLKVIEEHKQSEFWHSSWLIYSPMLKKKTFNFSQHTSPKWWFYHLILQVQPQVTNLTMLRKDKN